MCFSAKASFIAAGALGALGVASVRKVKHRKVLLLASTPLFFALQQACEGVVWITIANNASPHCLYTTAVYSFVFFAGSWWSIWIPTMLYILETHRLRKNLLLCTLIIGIITGTLYLISLLTTPIQVSVVNHHLYYSVLSSPFGPDNFFETLMPVLYLIATLVPFFISSVRFTWILGIILGASYVVSRMFYYEAIASTWCFFAALASICIYFIVREYEKKK